MYDSFTNREGKRKKEDGVIHHSFRRRKNIIKNIEFLLQKETRYHSVEHFSQNEKKYVKKKYASQLTPKINFTTFEIDQNKI